jgi:hypothetical protein
MYFMYWVIFIYLNIINYSRIMADKISICTYNVHGFNDTKVPYLQTVIDRHNIVFIQEHWLFNSQSDIFEDTFSNISAYSVWVWMMVALSQVEGTAVVLYYGRNRYYVLLHQCP